MTITRQEAEKRSRDPKVIAMVKEYPGVFGDTDRSIALHHKLGVSTPWDEWEWPRRLADLRIHEETAKRYEAGHTWEQLQEKALEDAYGDTDE